MTPAERAEIASYASAPLAARQVIKRDAYGEAISTRDSLDKRPPGESRRQGGKRHNHKTIANKR